VVDREGECEQEIAQAIRPLEQLGRDGLDLVEMPELALCSARDGPRDMEVRGRGRPPRQYEAPKGLETLGEPVDIGLQTADVALADTVARSGADRGELALGDEDLVLEAEKEFGRVASSLGQVGGSAAEVGPQLVERAEGPDPRGGFPYAGAAQETGLASVPGTGV
jgi:hypothetical protein